ncbi:MAG: alkaline phosphatase family protein [Spirochaetes bacterium]|nr:alkaline phosphatase family protein [Spirochaetota bacterium]
MKFPDYTKDNIVNLTSSLLKAFNVEPLYPDLMELKNLKNYKNIILLVIDGLGWKYFEKNGKDTIFSEYFVKKLSSVFPSTTASATTTLETGVAPQQHGITGWFMLLKELGIIAKILPFMPRYGGQSLPDDRVQRNDIYREQRLNDKIRNPSFLIYPENIVDNKVNKRNSNLLTYKTLNGMFLQIGKALKSSSERKYIYSYWENFDSLSHRYGISGKKVFDHFMLLNEKLIRFIKSIKNTNTALLITADHGLIDTEKSKIIFLNDYPDIYDMLTLPLCGEPRAAYCYVHPEKTKDFEFLVKKRLGNCLKIYKSSTLLKKGAFGLYEPHEMLKHRIGDYTLVMKENYIIRDKLFNERRLSFTGNHGGLSDDEKYVPLIWIKDI